MKTILVVDDELANAEVLSLILTEEGYKVFCASNGRHGLERTAELQPDLVITDFMMPVMNGGEMGRVLREGEATRPIRIIVTSGLSEAAVRRHFEGYDAFVRKPYAFNVMLKVIREVLGR